MDWLKRLLCAHQYEKVAELKDNDDDPKAVTVARMCVNCGHFIERTFRAPEDTTCPPHKWATTSTHPVHDEGSTIASYHRLHQRCTQCGEVRAIDLRPVKAAKA